jgi:hypothetical protein
VTSNDSDPAAEPSALARAALIIGGVRKRSTALARFQGGHLLGKQVVLRANTIGLPP